MIRYILIALIISALHSACTSSDKETDWTIEHSETIVHAEIGAKKIQIVNSTFHSRVATLIDTSIIVRLFKDTLFFEEIEYQLKNGDSTKRRHQINEFNSNGMVLSEIDSVNGALRSQRLRFYEHDKLQREELLLVLPNYNNELKPVGADTSRITSINIYNDIGQCTKVVRVSNDHLSSALTGTNKYDTSVTHKQFNEQSRETVSFTITSGDTTSISRVEYNALGRVIAIILWSDQGGLTITKFEYDGQGNTISELFTDDEIRHLTLTEYDSLNRPVRRKTFTGKTSMN